MLRVLYGALSEHPQAMCGCLLYAGTGIMGNICYGQLGFHLASLVGARCTLCVITARQTLAPCRSTDEQGWNDISQRSGCTGDAGAAPLPPEVLSTALGEGTAHHVRSRSGDEQTQLAAGQTSTVDPEDLRAR